MSILKCKMCGGTLKVMGTVSVCVCEYCNTKQTIPQWYDSECIELYNKASYFRQNADFDRAEQIYENIIKRMPDDAESYWSIVLCRYGIEYIEDPVTLEYIPTCHRVSFDSVLEDEAYLEILSRSTPDAIALYQKEASRIERIRKRILEISGKEEPFDIFICYKETDKEGNRTSDSVKAQEIYDLLTSKGYKVFFSKITLEKKIGQSYEPYIFSALNTAKIMLVVGSSQENLESVWVRNEWSRYIKIMQQQKGKTLIPCYFNMSLQDLPQELSYFQTQDLSAYGSLQEIVRGIGKIVPINAADDTASVSQESLSFIVDETLKQIVSEIDKKQWDTANTLCGKLLMLDPDTNVVFFFKALIAYHLNSDVSMMIKKLKQVYPELTEQEKSFITENNCRDYFDLFLKYDCITRAAYIGHTYPMVFDMNFADRMVQQKKGDKIIYCSALNYAIYYLRDIKMTENLLKCGANPNTSYRSVEGSLRTDKRPWFKGTYTPLSDAITFIKDNNLVKMLLAYGADPNIPSRVSAYPAEYDWDNERVVKFNALSEVIEFTKDIDMFSLLLQYGANPNYILDNNDREKPEKMSMLCKVLVNWRDKKAILQLIRYGAHWNSTVVYHNIKKKEKYFPYQKELNIDRDFVRFLRSTGWKGRLL